MFKQADGSLVYEKLHARKGVNCYLKLIVPVESIEDFFKMDSKTFKVAGNRNHFGIYVRIPDGKLPRKNRNTIGRISYELVISGNNNGIYYDNPKRKTPREQSVPDSPRTPAEIPDSVKWAVSHPYQGGLVSPK